MVKNSKRHTVWSPHHSQPPATFPNKIAFTDAQHTQRARRASLLRHSLLVQLQDALSGLLLRFGKSVAVADSRDSSGQWSDTERHTILDNAMSLSCQSLLWHGGLARWVVVTVVACEEWGEIEQDCPVAPRTTLTSFQAGAIRRHSRLVSHSSLISSACWCCSVCQLCVLFCIHRSWGAQSWAPYNMPRICRVASSRSSCPLFFSEDLQMVVRTACQSDA